MDKQGSAGERESVVLEKNISKDKRQINYGGGGGE